MTKYCVICGKPFETAPSNNKTTCSPGCRSIRAARAAKKSVRKWSPEARQRRANNAAVTERMSQLQPVGTAAALAIPEGQRGPQNRESKRWVLIDPSRNTVSVKNLLDWGRKNYTLFEPPSADPEQAAIRIRAGFGAIASTMRQAPSRAASPVTTYKGWGLLELPSKDDPDDK